MAMLDATYSVKVQKLCGAGNGAADHFHSQGRNHHHAEIPHLSAGCCQPPLWQVSSLVEHCILCTTADHTKPA